ncbi:MAG: OmpH family outer membrane protein [Thermodesulfobacteriota bacterium]
MKRITVYVVLSLLLAAAAHAQDKVGFINMQRLLAESEEGKVAAASFEKEFAGKKADLDKRFQDVERLRILLEQEGPRMTEEKRADLILQYDRKASEYERTFRQTDDEMRKKNAELIAEVLRKADSVMREVAKERDYSIVVKDINTMGYLDPRVDITDDVLKRMKAKREAAAKAPAAPASKPATK